MRGMVGMSRRWIEGGVAVKRSIDAVLDLMGHSRIRSSVSVQLDVELVPKRQSSGW